ncbi:MAG TPA: hypothetical protein VLC71_11755 [Thermomonas sp.]|nr:hypothetical protein [Thermomonas sp.]
MVPACPHCGCTAADDRGAHALLGMLACDDLDAAIARGLLDAQPCAGCGNDCNARLITARDGRRVALAARERHRARAARLQRRKAERETARTPPATASNAAAALPVAAADALARALAKARARQAR